MGYGEKQMKDLEQTIAAAEVDAVIIGTPIDLSRVIKIDKPSTRIAYDLDEYSDPSLSSLIAEKIPG
jgi:predicted GTPase